MRKTNRSKYNVSLNREKRTCQGITFDSRTEMKYYRDVLLPKVESGEVTYYELQKEYILQDGFKRNGKSVRPITYIADFYIEYADGRIEVIDVKGLADTLAVVKRKLFWKRYPDIDYKWVAYEQRFGGWGDYDEYKRRKNALKRGAHTIKNIQKEGADNGSKIKE